MENNPSSVTHFRSRWRAKVYTLKESGDWEDHGPGYAEIVENISTPVADDKADTIVSTSSPTEAALVSSSSSVGTDGSARLSIRSENQDDILLVDIELRFTGTHDSFRRNGTIITWESPTTETEIAISFQESQGCTAIWEKLCRYFRVPLNAVTIHCNNEQHPTASYDDQDTYGTNSSSESNPSVTPGTTIENTTNPHPLIDDQVHSSKILHQSSSSMYTSNYDSNSNPYLPYYNDYAGKAIHESSVPSSSSDGGEPTSSSSSDETENNNSNNLSRFRTASEIELSQDSTSDHTNQRAQNNVTPSFNDSTDEPLLPKPDLTSLNRIRKTITELERDFLSADKLILFLLNNDAVYLRQLFLEVFNEAEDLHDYDTMVDFYHIADKILQLNDNTIIDVLTSDGIFEGFIGALEYSQPSDTTETPTYADKKDYRTYLRTKCHFRQVVPIDDSDLLTRIHQNFRIQFLKDYILSRNYSETVLAQLSSIITFNTNEICGKILNNSAILRDIAHIITNPSKGKDIPVPSTDQPIVSSSSTDNDTANKVPDHTVTRERKDALLFIQELVNIGRSKPVTLRATFFRTLNERLSPVYSLLEYVIGDRHASVEEVLTTFDIMIAFATNDAVALREYALSQKRHPPLPLRKLNPTTSAWTGSTVTQPPSDTDHHPSSSTGASSDHSVVTVDDGLSIRLHDKLLTLGLLRSSDWQQHVSRWKEYNVENRRNGEHGRLVENVTSISTLLYKLVWRAVDDPDQGIQSTACDILRLILDFDPALTFGPSTAIAEIFFQHYVPWLVIPFTHNDLLDPLNNDPKVPMENLKSLLSSSLDPISVAPAVHPDIQEKVVRRLANGFDSMGLESKVSKYSKATIADFICWCFTSHLLRMKTVANRCSLYTNMLRLLRYREKLLIVQGVRILRTLIGLKDPLLNTEVIGKALLSPVAAALLLNAKRPNLVHSAIVELFDYIRNLSDSRQLMAYLKSHFQPLIDWAGITSLSNYDQSKSNVTLSPTSAWSSNDYYSTGNELHQNRNDDGTNNLYSSSYDKTNESSTASNRFSDNIYNSITSSRDDDLRSSKYFDDIDDDDDDDDDDEDEEENDELSRTNGTLLRRPDPLNSTNRSESSSLFASTGSQVAQIQAVASGDIQSTGSNDNDRKRPRDEFDFDEDDSSATVSTSGSIGGKIGLRTLLTVNRRSSTHSNSSANNDQTIPLSGSAKVDNTSVPLDRNTIEVTNPSDEGETKPTTEPERDTFIEPTEFFQNKRTKNNDDDDDDDEEEEDDDLLFRKSNKPKPLFEASSSSLSSFGTATMTTMSSRNSLFRSSSSTPKLMIGAWRTTTTTSNSPGTANVAENSSVDDKESENTVLEDDTNPSKRSRMDV